MNLKTNNTQPSGNTSKDPKTRYDQRFKHFYQGKSAEKFSYWSTKKANMFKAKSPIEHIYALLTCLTLTDTLTHIGKHTHTHTHYDSRTLIPQPNMFSLY